MYIFPIIGVTLVLASSLVGDCGTLNSIVLDPYFKFVKVTLATLIVLTDGIGLTSSLAVVVSADCCVLSVPAEAAVVDSLNWIATGSAWFNLY